MKRVVQLLVFAIALGVTSSCLRSDANAKKPNGKSTAWEVTILSATRGELRPSGYPPKTSMALTVKLELKYVGAEDKFPALDGKFLTSVASVSVGEKHLAFQAWERNTGERAPGQEFTENFSFEDPGPEPPGPARQFILKYGDVSAIPFTLTEEKLKTGG
jgi:hypothetical protein